MQVGAEGPGWAEIGAALDRALDLDGAAREAFVAALAPGVRAAVRHGLAEDPLLDHAEAAHAALAEAPAPAAGARFGPYAIEALVGEGGMGRVYRARRADGAFERTVALKVVRASLALAGTDVAARLRRERALLAALDHPHIARLVDGGETADGVPYLVTDFVDGEPITAYAARRGLGAAARVRLVAQVARAVDHAHRRFVVHRDLKPSNVLVAEADGAPHPMVLDFGIAKLLEAADDGAAPLTRTGQRMLTPAYAAPELFDPAQGVTAAADVYGLGAILYELLTGQRPHDDAAAAPTGAPTRPSRAVTAALPAQTPPSELPSEASGPPVPPRRLRGDLDTICLKALHFVPARRYDSAAALAEDLERHLDGRPVVARPDSPWYVASRFARRNRALVAAAALAVGALVVGFGLTLAALGREQAARAESEMQAERAVEAAELLGTMLKTANPDHDPTRTMTVADAVEQGVAQVRAVESRPLRAYLLLVLGEAYISLGKPAHADTLLWHALALHDADTPADDAVRVRQSLLATQDALSRPDRVLTLTDELLRLDPESAGRTHRWRSRAFSDLGRTAEAVEAARAGHAAATAPHEQIGSAARLGEALLADGQAAESLGYLEQAVQASLELHGPDHGATSNALASLGRARGATGDFAGAEAALRQAIAFHAERYGPTTIGYPLASLGEVHLRAGRPRAAAAALDSAATMAGSIIGAAHLDVLAWRALQAEALVGAGDPRAGRAVAERALAALGAAPEADVNARARDEVEARLRASMRRG